jgi:hypothetical protein
VATSSPYAGPCYASVTVEQIVGTSGVNENLELDFVGGDGEKTLGDTTTPMDPCSPPDCDNDDHDSSLEPPSAPSPPGQRARSSPTPPTQEKEKKKTSSLPSPGPTNKKLKTVKKKICPKNKWAYEKLAYEMT